MTRITSDLIKRETGEFDIEIAKWLSLPGRSIGKIEGLGSCICLLTLDLSHNNIGEIVGLEALAALQRLNLSHNSISRLGGLENTKALEYLDVKNNRIANVDDVSRLAGLAQLRQLHLANNPACSHPAYYTIISERLPGLRILDGESVDLRQSMADAYLQAEDADDAPIYDASPPTESWFAKEVLEVQSESPEAVVERRLSRISSKLRESLEECADLETQAEIAIRAALQVKCGTLQM